VSQDDTPGGPARLALYYYDGCFFCYRVRRVIDQLGVEVELRNIHTDRQHMSELMAARGGRRTVPVLRVMHADGDEWIPESADIVDWLRARSTQ
jgi:glutaredoxin 2